MKEMWEKPRIAVEAFAPNDYVAACWGVGCNWNDANEYELKIGNAWYEKQEKPGSGRPGHGSGGTTEVLAGQTHSEDHCGFSGNQVIFDDNNDGIADRMVEVGTDGLGNLTCTLYEDEKYTTVMSVSSVTTAWFGNLLFWTTTTSSGDRTWYHQGIVNPTVPNHPNRS